MSEGGQTRATVAAPIQVTSAPANRLQRACACGQHTHGEGECAECRKKHDGTLRRAPAGPAHATAPAIVHKVLGSPGQPLDAQTRAFMEPRFGHDFSGVRVHTDTKAAESYLGRPRVARQPAHTIQQVPAPTMNRDDSAPLIISSPNDSLEQEADLAAARIISGMQAAAPHAGSQAGTLVRSAAGAGTTSTTGDSVLRRKDHIEERSRYDFSQVRVHTDTRAAESAGAINARAYTVGTDIVFGAGQYAPQTMVGRELLAHELTHVVQQHDAVTRKVVRRKGTTVGGFFANILSGIPVIGILFRQSEKDLEEYLKTIDTTGEIEDDDDSDDKAIAIVNVWNKNESRYVLTARRKAILILEMLSGWVGEDEQNAILDLLERSDNPDLEYFFGAGKVKHEKLLSEFGAKRDQLYRFYRRRYPDAYPPLDINKLLGDEEEAPRKPDIAKLKESKPTGSIVQIGDKLPETTNPLYDSVKNKETKRRVDLVSLTEADDWINEVYGQYLPKDKKKSAKKKGFASANVPLHTESGGPEDEFEGFVNQCISRASSEERRDPEKRKKHEDRCRAEERNVAGFFDSSGPEIVVRTDRERPHTRLHEVIHAYAHPNIAEQFTRYAWEGLTEYLTRQIIFKRANTHKAEKPLAIGQSYGGPYQVMLELSLLVGEPMLAKAHFQGDITSLCKALGKKTFDAWLVLMEDQDSWQDAVNLIRQSRSSKGTGAEAAKGGKDTGAGAADTCS